MKIIRNQKGQSLMELLVALFILVSALAATVVLIVTSINAGRESRQRLISTNFAREGIEIVRNVRDSNWSDDTGVAWDDGLTDSNYVTAIPLLDDTNPISLSFDDYINPTPALIDNMNIKTDDTVYLQGQGLAENATVYYRLIYINPICQKSDGTEGIGVKDSTENCATQFDANYTKVGIRVISEVHWKAYDSNKKVIVEDRLYNWQIL